MHAHFPEICAKIGAHAPALRETLRSGSVSATVPVTYDIFFWHVLARLPVLM